MSWKIVEIRDMLKEMLDKFEEINDETVEQQDYIEKIRKRKELAASSGDLRALASRLRERKGFEG